MLFAKYIYLLVENGIVGYKGDGSPAVEAELANPSDVTLSDDDSLYFSDPVNNYVRKVSPSDIITTAAGKGIVGFSGNGGPATEAAINHPWG